ncbi:MAG: solute:sodium symporter family transporter, partial [Plesiomonas shigelloides]
DPQVVSAGKKFGTVLAILSMVIAPFIANAPQGLFGYLQEVNGAYSIPILTIILVGIFSKKVPPVAAKIGLLSGVILYCISQFVLKPYVFGADNYPHFLHVMFTLFVLNVVIMLLIGMVRPMQRAWAPAAESPVDMTPYPMAKPFGLAIVLVVVSTYIFFN